VTRPAGRLLPSSCARRNLTPRSIAGTFVWTRLHLNPTAPSTALHCLPHAARKLTGSTRQRCRDAACVSNHMIVSPGISAAIHTLRNDAQRVMDPWPVGAAPLPVARLASQAAVYQPDQGLAVQFGDAAHFVQLPAPAPCGRPEHSASASCGDTCVVRQWLSCLRWTGRPRAGTGAAALCAHLPRPA